MIFAQSYIYDRERDQRCLMGLGLTAYHRQDVALVRVGRGLQERIEKEGKERGMKARVRLWAGAWEVEEMFPTL